MSKARTVKAGNGTKVNQFRCEEAKFISASVWANPTKKGGIRHSAQVQKGYYPTGSNDIKNMTIHGLGETELKCLIATSQAALAVLESFKKETSSEYTSVSLGQ